LNASTEGGIDAAFRTLVERHAGALLVPADPFFNSRREQLLGLASRHAVPAIYAWREFPVSGGLISYGPSLPAMRRQAGVYAGKILKGAKPADLPVQQPTVFELVVNLKTAIGARPDDPAIYPGPRGRGHRMRPSMCATHQSPRSARTAPTGRTLIASDTCATHSLTSCRAGAIHT